MGDCYDKQALWSLRGEITDCMSGYKGCYQRAYRCLGAAAEIIEDQRSALLTEALSHKLAKRARGILSREVPRRKGEEPGRVKQRFLGAITHRGPMTLYDTALAQCGRVYALTDNCGLAHELLIHLLAGVTAGGYDVVACPDPMAPDRLAHVIFPGLSLAFVTSSQENPWPHHAHRRLRLDAMADADVYRLNRPRLRFTKRVAAALLDEGIAGLGQAKEAHDRLEKLYNPYVDFDGVAQAADRLADQVLALRDE